MLDSEAWEMTQVEGRRGLWGCVGLGSSINHTWKCSNPQLTMIWHEPSITGSCESLAMGFGDRTQALCYNSKCLTAEPPLHALDIFK